MLYILGVDPGVNGGIARLCDSNSSVRVWGFKPSMTRFDLCAIIEDATAFSGVCYFEKVQYIRGDGGKGAFTFGRIVGLLEGMLVMRGMKPIDVYPMAWQANLNCMSGGNKNVTKRLAQELFPALKVTHGIADALLIAEYGRRRQKDKHASYLPPTS